MGGRSCNFRRRTKHPEEHRSFIVFGRRGGRACSRLSPSVKPCRFAIVDFTAVRSAHHFASRVILHLGTIPYTVA